MDTATAIELLMKSASKPTYPIARALTNPLSGLATGGAAGAGLGFLLAGPPGAAVGAPVGAGLNYLMKMLTRHLAPGQLRSLSHHFPAGLMKSERGAIESVISGKKIAAIGAPLAAVTLAAASHYLNRHLYGKALQGRIERGGVGLTGKEREMINATRVAVKRESAIRAIKGSLKGAGALAAIAAAVYAGKKLSDSKKKK